MRRAGPTRACSSEPTQSAVPSVRAPPLRTHGRVTVDIDLKNVVLPESREGPVARKTPRSNDAEMDDAALAARAARRKRRPKAITRDTNPHSGDVVADAE